MSAVYVALVCQSLIKRATLVLSFVLTRRTDSLVSMDTGLCPDYPQELFLHPEDGW